VTRYNDLLSRLANAIGAEPEQRHCKLLVERVAGHKASGYY